VNTGELAIFLNKSQISGYPNGDMALSMVIINDTSGGIAAWKLPNWYYYMSYSWAN
jgi:hypothetical protein